MELKNALGINLRDRMKERGVTQIQLAEKLGVHQTTVSTWIQGKKVPHFETLDKIADVLDTSVVALLDNGTAKSEFVASTIAKRPELEGLLYEASKVPPEEVDFAVEFLKRLNSKTIKG